MLFDKAKIQDYPFSTAPHCAVRIGVLNVTAQLPLTCGFFVPSALPIIYDRLSGAVARLAGRDSSTPALFNLSPVIGVAWRRYYNLIRVTIMNTPNSNVVQLRPLNNKIPFSVSPAKQSNPELIQNLPFLLESTISYLLADFDYANNQSSNTAVAIRILATTADRLITFLEVSHA